jgi:tetratricopeptide (TPR) repeat protein
LVHGWIFQRHFLKYRAYANLCLFDFEKAYLDYEEANKIKVLQNASKYNKQMCLVFRALEKKDYSHAIWNIEKSNEFLANCKEMVYYHIVALLSQGEAMRKTSLDILNSTIGNGKQDYFLCYYKGLLLITYGNYYDAITEISKAIKLCEDPKEKYFYYRAMCYASLSMFKEAINDFSIAIKINENYIDAYLNKGKCEYLEGNTNNAFADFEKMMTLKPVYQFT